MMIGDCHGLSFESGPTHPQLGNYESVSSWGSTEIGFEIGLKIVPSGRAPVAAKGQMGRLCRQSTNGNERVETGNHGEYPPGN